MISSEAVPFAKSGGLGDAVSALAVSLSELGHDVRLLIPRYYSIPRDGLKALEGPMGVPMGDSERWTQVFSALLPDSHVPVYFLDYEAFFGRAGVYGASSREEYPDNPQRFALLSRAAFQLCRKISWIPDILHAHDWPSSLVPVYLSTLERTGDFSKTASVLSIHNLGYQGVYPKEHFPFFGLDWRSFHGAGFEFHDSINLLKAGICGADCLSTVSPTYAREIQTPAYGFGLDGLLRYRSRDLVGILNGVDYKVWNPEIDPHIPATYSVHKREGKAICKKALQEGFGLPVDPDLPLIGMVARLTEQKGIEEMFGKGFGAIPEVCRSMAAQFAVIGSGEAWCEEELESLSERFPNFKARIGYDDKLAHLVEAGSDFFLMPSRYEPCGLNQMYSLRYGTLPIVHRTGGLADSVQNYVQETGDGTGFMFDDLTPRALYNTIGWAVWAWYNRGAHIEMMRAKAMTRVFSWEKSAREYTALYGRAFALGRSRFL
ncbi:Glycogen synthase [uncultured Spirochaetota bacterium]|jgi:starch synthase|uniref:Glycogen synthase n=1 Tax=uncultured Spirochaetota bacterium TaxID=460511 RepID=A0A652ZXR0_9SPIR|nr:Glycogen synthase [uncultured Spirochaetota bacterium]